MSAPRTRAEVLAHLAASRVAYEAEHAGDAPRAERVFRHALPADARRHTVGGNGAPLEPGQALAELGAAIYGPRWKQELSEVLGVSVRTLHRMVDEESPVSPVILHRLRQAVERQAARTARCLAALEASVAGETEDL